MTEPKFDLTLYNIKIYPVVSFLQYDAIMNLSKLTKSKLKSFD